MPRRWVDGHGFDPVEDQRSGTRVVEALQKLHQCNVVHNDCKSENVIVTEDGSVVFIDLDVAQVSMDAGLLAYELTSCQDWVTQE